MANYDKMTTEDFDTLLVQIMNEHTGEQIFAIPGIYEVVSEYFNDEVLDRWAKDNPELAYPEDYADEDDEEEDETP